MSPSSAAAQARDAKPAPRKSRLRLSLIGALVIVVFAVLIRPRLFLSPDTFARGTGPTQITHDGLAKSNVLSDGSNLYVTESLGGQHVISQVVMPGGQSS